MKNLDRKKKKKEQNRDTARSRLAIFLSPGSFVSLLRQSLEDVDLDRVAADLKIGTTFSGRGFTTIYDKTRPIRVAF
jgi:acetyl-CoA carboxylase carboxyltransferase component